MADEKHSLDIIASVLSTVWPMGSKHCHLHPRTWLLDHTAPISWNLATWFHYGTHNWSKMNLQGSKANNYLKHLDFSFNMAATHT